MMPPPPASETPTLDTRAVTRIAPDSACPTCGTKLQRVRNDTAYLNDDQFDSVRAGDWFCTTCKDPSKRSAYRYFWTLKEVAVASRAPEPTPPPTDERPLSIRERAEIAGTGTV